MQLKVKKDLTRRSWYHGPDCTKSHALYTIVALEMQPEISRARSDIREGEGSAEFTDKPRVPVLSITYLQIVVITLLLILELEVIAELHFEHHAWIG